MKKRIVICLSVLMIGMMSLTGCGGQTSEKSAEVSSADSSFEENYPISKESMDTNGYLVTVNSEGTGQIARAEEGRTLAFDEKTQTTGDHLKEGTKLVLAAKPGEGSKFSKWTLNGKDYSTDEQINYTVTEDADFVAVFEHDE